MLAPYYDYLDREGLSQFEDELKKSINSVLLSRLQSRYSLFFRDGEYKNGSWFNISRIIDLEKFCRDQDYNNGVPDRSLGLLAVSQVRELVAQVTRELLTLGEVDAYSIHSLEERIDIRGERELRIIY